MKTFAALLSSLALAGCVTTTTSAADPRWVTKPVDKSANELAAESAVRGAFEAWKEATMAGDVDTHYAGMTPSMVSHWLWGRVEDHGDLIMAKWLGILPAAQRKELETWREWHHKHQPDRAELLPATILGGDWIKKAYAEYFTQSFGQVKQSLSLAEVKQVAVDAQGATVITSLMGQATEAWVMVVGGDGKWYVDGYIPPNRGPRAN